MAKLTLYNFWIPDKHPPCILIAGDHEIHSLFIEEFSDYDIQQMTWKPHQRQYDYGFYVHNATERDKQKFNSWLESYKVIEVVPLENNFLDKGYALSYHTGRVAQLVRKAKPYGIEVATSGTKAAAAELVEILVEHLYHLQETDYFVAVPYLNKSFDLPEFMTNEISKKTGCANGSVYLEQVREKKHSQKDLESIVDKQNNVKDLFRVKHNHPFSGKIITIIDDIYRSGTTIDELAKMLKQAGAKAVQALVLTKTFRD